MKRLHLFLLLIIISSLQNYSFAQPFLISGNNSIINFNDDQLIMEKKWSISIMITGAGLGPSDDIKKVMEREDFDKRSHNLFGGGTTEHPFSRTGEMSWLLSVKHYLTLNHSLGLFIGNTNFNSTYGYHDQVGYLFVDYSAICLAPVYSINIYDLIRLGIGPALYFTKAWESSTSNSEENNFNNIKIGLLLDVGLRTPSKSTFFSEFIFQYRIVGRANVGPFTVRNNHVMASLSKTNVNYNHYLIGAGVGMRF